MFSRLSSTSSLLGSARAVVTWTVILAFASVSTFAAYTGPARTFGALSVTSDPPGAAVYIDGEFVGKTPLAVEQVAAGDHRVKVVKDGYLENGRVVTVTTGEAKTVNVKLTAGTSTTSTRAVAAPGGGLFSNKLFWLGVIGVGGLTYALTKSSNAAPTAGTATATPATAAQGVAVNFAATGASDPDGDSLTYAWEFGDGTTGTGATTSHAYATAGNFTATVTVSDGKKSATATVAVVIRTLTAVWTGTLQGVSAPCNITQNGTTLTGFCNIPVVTSNNGVISAGSIQSNGNVAFTVTFPGFQPFTFTGTVGTGVNSLNGAANGSGFVNTTWNLTRS